TSTASGLTFNSDGTYSFDASSYDSLSKDETLDIVVPVTVTDEVGGTDTTTLTITVTGTNDDPVAVSKTDAMAEDASISGQLAATDVDLPSGSSLSFTTTSTATGLTLNSDGSYTFDGSSYDSLSKDETLDIVVPVTVTDEVGGTDTTTLTITITGTNDDPVANIASADVLEDSNLTGVVTASDVDLPSSSNLTFSTTSTATGLTFNSNGTYSFDASSYDSLSKDETLDIVVPVTVTDEVGGTDTTTLTITVIGTNDDPVAVSKIDAVTEDTSISGQLAATDVDLPSGSSLSFTTTSTATGLTLNSDGSYTFDASSYDSLSKDETLDIVVPVTVTDEVGGTDTTTLTITITGTNDDPVANIASADVLEDSNLTGVVTASDVDLPSSSNLTFSTTSTATGLTFNSNGTYSFDASSYDSLSKDETLDIVVPVTVTD
ncbi:VCBS domain-containing protein, partial [Vibrio tapetis subsp. quintayensis]|uniref:VCBS domain-containing protein n=1 Tax=Vibrio tapetis TaxID=52443 RepID=UPI0025B485D4